ncbi:glutamate 5-kinase [Marinobacterium mangrovicola]|uniref:Glutamate 5-kinase n=1 Tax=Marinobacterium mangrovicola TaxID=1476959 RepID=A0A4R1GNE4_9GAMM|nr:glutamate 5-kinase [Marinobacterium mangrovicola]TCK05952.1 glutamate 5-kinase [Marinobacterium mangrovicola]
MVTGRKGLARKGRWVVKIGSALLTNDGQGLDLEAIGRWVAQVAELRARGIEVVMVSSGSIAEGMKRLGWTSRPREIYRQQAAAAVGQMGLVRAYESAFERHSLRTAQVLLTHDDLSNRKRYLNARSTLCTLIELGVIAVVNENDTVVTSEIRFGDNDTLGALVANAIEADALILLTDQQGLYEADPRSNPDAAFVHEARADDKSLIAMAGGGGKLGRGGMATKVRAARLAARSGAQTVIASGREDDVLLRLFAGEALGTLLVPEKEPVAARKQWIAGHLQARGTLTLDAGAVKALVTGGKSLLPAGVKAVQGDFSRGEMVLMQDEAGAIVARGLVNYGTGAARQIIGHASGEIVDILGFVGEPELVHRDNLVLA